jgi:hypothetical protein
MKATHFSSRARLAVDSAASTNTDLFLRNGGYRLGLGGACAARKEKVKVLPVPAPAEVAVHDPPSSIASCCEMASPNPDPPYERVMLESIWLKDLNSRSISAGRGRE